MQVTDNQFTIDPLHGTITKASTSESLHDEILYYQSMPARFEVFFPRLISANSSGPNYELELELYNYPNVAEQWVNNQIPDYEALWGHLGEVLDMWAEHTGPTASEDAYARYITEPYRAYEQFRDQGIWPGVFKKDYIYIGHVADARGRRITNFLPLWETFKPYILDRIIPGYQASFVHGDLTLSNILRGPNDALRFIDPKGSFGSVGHWGDIRWDVAKLYQSIDGGYDYLTTDRFSIGNTVDRSDHWAATPYKYELYKTYNDGGIPLKKFREIFFKRRYSEKDITLLEGLSFIEQCARHTDNPERQMVLYLVGVERLNRASLLGAKC